MTTRRQEALESIGSTWASVTDDDKWYKRLDELKAYRAEAGDCVVPCTDEYRPLRNWIGMQRHYYRKWKAREPCKGFTAERRDALESIGFSWPANQEKES